MYIILNKELEPVAEITTFSSINWEEEYLSQSGGDFEIVLPADTYSNLGIEDGFFIYKTDSLKFGIVNYIEYTDNFTENEEIEQLITLKGEMGESILKRRVLSFQLNKSGTLDDLAFSVLYTHFINPKDSRRKINLVYFRDESFNNYVSKCITGCTVAELMESLCSMCDCSYRIYLNLNDKRFYFELIKGNDKSANVVFCKRDNNLSEFTFVKSKESYVSHIVVAGEGEGSDRKTVTVSNDNQTGLDRIEAFLDKKSLSSKDMDELTYINKLQEEGKVELSKYRTTEASSFDIFLNNYEYRNDFNLGDKVTIKNETLGIETTTRVLAALTSVDENGIESTQLTLGDIAEIELAEDEKTLEQEEYTPEETDDNGEIIDTTWDTKVTQITPEYLKIYAEDENGVTLSDLEFSGGFFKIAENVYIMCLKNNTAKKIKKISYSCDENILKSENVIYGDSVIDTINCWEGHEVDSTSKHSYQCNITDYCNITKIVEVGEPYTEIDEVDGYKLYEAGTIKTLLCANPSCVYVQTESVNGEDTDTGSKAGYSFNTKRLKYLSPVSTTTTGSAGQFVTKTRSGNITYLKDEEFNNFITFLGNTITYTVISDYQIYYKIRYKDGSLSKYEKAKTFLGKNKRIKCSNEQEIILYVYGPKIEEQQPDYQVKVSLPSRSGCYISMYDKDTKISNNTIMVYDQISPWDGLKSEDGYYMSILLNNSTSTLQYTTSTQNILKKNKAFWITYIPSSIDQINAVLDGSEGLDEVQGIYNMFPKLNS